MSVDSEENSLMEESTNLIKPQSNRGKKAEKLNIQDQNINGPFLTDDLNSHEASYDFNPHTSSLSSDEKKDA